MSRMREKGVRKKLRRLDEETGEGKDRTEGGGGARKETCKKSISIPFRGPHNLVVSKDRGMRRTGPRL